MRRPSGTRLEGRLVLVCCEGRITEPVYLSRLRRYFGARTVVIERGLCSPGSTVLRASQLRRERIAARDWDHGRDEVWCVLDVEQAGANPGLAPAISEARRLGIRLAVSNPAFEYWFLLHYVCSTRPFACAEDLVRSLRQHIPGYQKNADLSAQLIQRLDGALSNATRARTLTPDSWDGHPNPSTTVDELVLALKSCGL
ncbi:MAG: RloB family protein [Anaerolineae bacterium]